ncbi:MAG: hypothetical protein ACR2KL_12985 [Nocardioidaceae bacterium]
MSNLMGAAASVRELPVPPFVIGLIAFGFLATLLLWTLAYGKGRPHT